MSNLLNEANQIFNCLIKHRRYLHQNAECAFVLPKTLLYIENELRELGYIPKRIGKASVYAQIGEGGDACLLRADIDALETEEQSGVPYASINGKMHSCGHDMHAAMLLGAAEIIAKHKDKLKSKVTLLFQGGEEILEGAKDVIDNGILELSNAKSAISLHAIPAIEIKTGTILLPQGGVVAPAADFFKVHLKGLACHGSTPWLGRDTLSLACKIISEIPRSITSKLPPSNGTVISVGRLTAGKAGNIIADSALFEGTVRCNSDEIQAKIKSKLSKVIENASELEEIKPDITYPGGAPTLLIDNNLLGEAEMLFKEQMGKDCVISATGSDSALGGSEDFAHFSHKIPSLLIGISAGAPSEGYTHPLHHPKVKFDERALPIGAACFSSFALR